MIGSVIINKQQDVVYVSDDERLNDIALLTDIIQHLSDSNVKLQGKSQLVNKMCTHLFFSKVTTFSNSVE